MNQFIDGAIMMAFCVAGLFFLRFWRQTGDRLFLLFAISFALMAVNRIGLSYVSVNGAMLDEHRTPFYVIRLVAFIIILVAIIDKNRTMKRSADGS